MEAIRRESSGDRREQAARPRDGLGPERGEHADRDLADRVVDGRAQRDEPVALGRREANPQRVVRSFGGDAREVRLADAGLAAQHDERRRGGPRPRVADHSDVGVATERRLGRGRAPGGREQPLFHRPDVSGRVEAAQHHAVVKRYGRLVAIAAHDDRRGVDEDLTGRAGVAQPGCHDDGLTEQVAALHHHVARRHPDADREPGGPCRVLQGGAGADQVVGGRQQRQRPVAGALHDVSAEHGDDVGDEGVVTVTLGVGGIRPGAHERRRRSDHVGEQDVGTVQPIPHPR